MSTLHRSQLARFVWPEPEDQSDEKVISDIHNYGCHLVGILPEENFPQYVFSIGLFVNFGQPEIVIFNPDVNRAAKRINDICRRAASGERFTAGNKSTPFLKHHGACLIALPPEIYPEYLGYAMWFYRSLHVPFPCLQFVWPDQEGRLPWEAAAGATFNAMQPVLSAKCKAHAAKTS
jgi:hypothetical protein